MTGKREWSDGARARRSGMMGLEMLAVIFIMGAVIAFAGHMGKELRDSSTATNLAHSLNLAAKGAQSYLDANSEILARAIGGDGGPDYVIVTEDGVEGANLDGDAAEGLGKYIPATLLKTRFGQEIVLYAYKGSGGSMEGLLATRGGVPAGMAHDGGEASAGDKRRYMNIARKVVGMNGFGLAMDRKVGGNELDPDGTEFSGPAIVGESDSWRFHFNDPDQGDIEPFDEGQLATPIYTMASGTRDDMLYRVKVDGKPELNTMRTDITMDGYGIKEAGTISIRQRAAGSSGDAGEFDTGDNGLIIEPHLLGRDTAPDDAGRVCEGKEDGFIFTAKHERSEGRAFEDMTGIWVCFDEKPRLVADSSNSTQPKNVKIVDLRASDTSEVTVQKPTCPPGTTPDVFVSAVGAGGGDKPAPLGAFVYYAEDRADGEWSVAMRLKTGEDGSDNWSEHKKDGVDYALVQTYCRRQGLE